MMYKDHSKEAMGGLISKMTQEGMADQSKLKRIPVEPMLCLAVQGTPYPARRGGRYRHPSRHGHDHLPHRDERRPA